MREVGVKSKYKTSALNNICKKYFWSSGYYCLFMESRERLHKGSDILDGYQEGEGGGL